jgi:anti-sigma regulatory factor (Ser/Thr protein kinase)
MAADDEPVRLILPAGTRYLRVARLVASSLATMAGADLDGVEDLRIAVDEL